MAALMCLAGPASAAVEEFQTATGTNQAAGVNTPMPMQVTPTTSPTAATLDVHCTVACSTTPTNPLGVHNLYNLTFSATVAGTLMIFDATACPADGTVAPYRSYMYPTIGTSMAISFGGEPLPFVNGIALCYSSTGPYSKTASTTAFIGAGYK